MYTITSKEFVHTFCDIWNSNDRRICFVLGAGASKSSGIRTGGELATQWLGEIESRMQDQPANFQAFLQAHNIDRNNPALSYPEIYQERFKLDYDTGFEFINREMESARPGYGYSVLAQILAEKQHNIIITTNFDNLTEDALYTYTSKRPLVCGHESLAVFAQPSVKRPLIVKIHRDRFFNPQSLPHEIEHINKLWIDALNSIFANSTPIFIGYGGNDGSLMGYLEQISSFQNIFWCERKGVPVSERVAALLNKFNGKLVEIAGFDELMFLLQDGLRLKLLHKEIVDIAQERSKMYKATVEKIRSSQAASTDPDAQKAAERIVDKADGDWWSWQLKAQAAKSHEEKEKVYEEGLKILPNSSDLNVHYARLLQDMGKHDDAETLFKKALQLSGEDDKCCCMYGDFLSQVRENLDEAENYYCKALQKNGADDLNHLCYAEFMRDKRKNFEIAQEHYLCALDLDSSDATNNSLYALFLDECLEDHDGAEVHYLKALEAKPDDAVLNSWYAEFLERVRENDSKAEKYFKKALKLNPQDPGINYSYAVFLEYTRGNAAEAEKYYKKSGRLRPEIP